MNIINPRTKFLNYVKAQLMGNGKDILFVKPLNCFFTGFLSPISEPEQEEDNVEEYGDNAEVEQVKSSIKLRQFTSSSAGFSFFITGDIKLRVFCDAVCYKKDAQERDEEGRFAGTQWHKKSLADGDIELEFSPNSQSSVVIFNDRAKVHAMWRKYQSGYLVTLTIINIQILDNTTNNTDDRNSKTLFKVGLRCIVQSGEIGVYPKKDNSLLNKEEREIELRYQNVRTYAVGHGVGVDWHKNTQKQWEIWIDFMPAVEVPQVTADVSKGKEKTVLSFAFLQTIHNTNAESVFMALKQFIDDYQDWIEQQSGQIQGGQDSDTEQSILQKLNIAKNRMYAGLKLIKSNQEVRTAFGLMNQAMLMQWLAGDKNRGIVKEESEYCWRSFQLGFILMALSSTVDENDEHRDTLDLIWFPTGGGKTEAYLGLMSLLFVYRRLKYSHSYGGTTALMRYTLRLLTSQQFLRANKVIFALELIRKKGEISLGSKPFTSGIWLGSSTSPNTFKQAQDALKEAEYSQFILSNCPWCNASFSSKNYIATDNSFHFSCKNSACDFGKNTNNVLPCNVVDEALYENPPTLLIATVDKFARLVWEDRASHFFGKGNNRPPELIIQDELHLISGALGSIVGLYESGIETALMTRGMYAKYIASTATIKNSAKQVQAIFSKTSSIFPAVGLRHDDSYFAKTVKLSDKSGRLYVGYLAPRLSQQDCLAPLAATLLAAPIKLFKDEVESLDNWWTQIIYHGSLRGIHNSTTLYQGKIKTILDKQILNNLRDDIEEISPGFTKEKKLETLQDFQHIDQMNIKQIVKQYTSRQTLISELLSSQQSANDNAIVFDNLTKTKDEQGAIDVVLATNMIATGLDVTRLALMVINGQPLTTAEYIQSSSRVGRGQTPGIVFANYYKSQTRSLSHYENFRSYHDSFYRFVEPSSLTPFTYQARSRALHAALIIAIRCGNAQYSDNDDAEKFDPNKDAIKVIIKNFKERCQSAIGEDCDLIAQTHNHIDQLVAHWADQVSHVTKNKRNLVYASNGKVKNSLICSFEATQKKCEWQTLNSMRNIENSALIKTLKGVKNNEQ